ncbi:hypothetical protein EDC01DRAFT_778679 [Geopyxis carbonaria]|nr:hypothetical protein EDC01DRAFT_778679 [Geopyxis carbonaria]
MAVFNTEAHEEMVAWAVENGGFMHSSLKFCGGPIGASVIATAKIPAGTPLVTCSRKLAITHAAAATRFPAPFSAGVESHTLLCFFLCQQKLAGDLSFWAPYIDTLPNKFDTPLYFDDADKAFLDGCNMGEGDIEGRREAWQAEWKQGVEVLQGLWEATEGYTWELFLWAATIFTSRCFPETLLDSVAPSIPGEKSAGETRQVLFPLVDSLNHKPLTKVTWRSSADKMTVVAESATKADHEVFNNYGPKSNEELLMGYGFAIKDNPTDSVALRMAPPLSPVQASIRALQPQPATPNIFHISMHAKPAIPDSLICLFRLLTATPLEAPLLAATPAERVSTRNELAAYTHLYYALSMKLRPFATDCPEPQNNKQSFAAVYRRGQHVILSYALGYVEAALQVLQGEESFVTLRTALWDERFAPAVEACFETKVRVELEAAGQGDLVLVLYLCWRYINGDWPEWFAQAAREYNFDPSAPAAPAATTADDEDEDMDEDDDDGAEETFAALFPDAAEEAPEVFGGPAWTPQLLGWMVRVFRGESVDGVVPGHGDGGAGDGSVCGVSPW